MSPARIPPSRCPPECAGVGVLWLRRLTRLALILASIGGWASGGGQQTSLERPPQEYLRSGQRALDWTRRFVALGERPAGSAALRTQADLIARSVRALPCDVSVDEFTASTPLGDIPMRNIVARFGPAGAEGVIVLSGHYDTKALPGFVGANDGGSSAALLMVLAERIARHSAIRLPVWIVFFDGEESVLEWRDGDHTYGSRRIAGAWKADGTAARIRMLINVDMIGDASLNILREGYSDARLRREVWGIARSLGYQHSFSDEIGYVEDDHLPFLEAGIPSLNLIDFDYGPGNSYWHTTEDSIDRLSAASFGIVLHVLEEVLRRANAL